MRTVTSTRGPNLLGRLRYHARMSSTVSVLWTCFYTHLRGQSLPVLNIICHGTNFQVAALLQQDGTPPAAVVWSTFQRSWRRYFGTPDDITRTVVRSAAEISHNPGNTLAFCRQSSTLMRPGRTGSAKDTGDSLSEGTRDRGSFHA